MFKATIETITKEKYYNMEYEYKDTKIFTHENKDELESIVYFYYQTHDTGNLKITIEKI